LKSHTGIKDAIHFLIIAVMILAFSSIPYWAARSVETDELLFRGAYFDEMDYAVHISMMQAGRMGSWAYEMRFTSEEHRPAFLRMFYVILGHISKWINLSVETTYHLARWIFGFVALYSIFQLCLKVFQEKKLAQIAFLLCALGGGAGFLQLFFNSELLKSISPIEFWLIDAYVFFSISIFPSFSFTLALMTTALNLYLDYLVTDKWKMIVFICLIAAISQITNPIAFAMVDIAFAGATFFLWWKNRKVKLQQFHALGVIAFAQTPLLVYNFLILDRDPFWSQFTLQNQTLSPSPVYFIWGFAPFWLLAIYGMILAFREKNTNMTAMSAWTISGFVLAYLPLFIQRRFLLGITIPLGILAIYGANHFIKQISIKIPPILKRERLIYLTYILLSSISFINLSLGSSLYLQTRPVDNFYPRDLESTLLWLDNNAVPNDFVLGDIKTGQLVAQRTRLKTFVGHPMETLFFDDKITAVEAYYEGNAPEAWIQKTPIQWVVYGPYEEELAPSFTPNLDLILVYQNNTVLVYKVNH
jgi:hypothetical protein